MAEVTLDFLKEIPQALDVKHPDHEEWWAMLVTGGIMLSDAELDILFKVARERGIFGESVPEG